MLEDISNISCFKKLKHLSLVSNKKLYDYSPIKELHSLESLTLVGQSDSLSWLKNMSGLCELRLDCKLEDKNLDFLYEMPSLRKIRLVNKSGQSVKEQDIISYLEAKSL